MNHKQLSYSVDEINELLEKVETIWQEIVNARSSYSNINGRFTDVDKSIKILTGRSTKLNSDQKSWQYSFFANIRREINNADFALAIVADPHFNDAELRPKLYNSALEMKMAMNIANTTNINDVYVLGDILNGDYNNSILYNDACEFKKLSEKALIIHGNHDCGGYIENLQIMNPSVYGSHGAYLLPNSDLYNMFYRDNDVTEICKETLAFYKDYDDAKIRVVHVNTNDVPNVRDDNGELIYNPINWKGISPLQLKWLVEHAFNFTGKSGWKIIIVSHAPLEPALDSEEGFDYYYDGGTERVANQNILREMIRQLNSGITTTLTPSMKSVPTTDYGTIKKITSDGFTDITCSSERHAMNKKYFATNYTIDKTETDFTIALPQSIKVPVIACLSGHIHTDDHYLLDDTTHHITLSALANSNEDTEPDLNEFAITVMIVKDAKLFFFRIGRNMGTVSDDMLISGTTNYGIKTFANKTFTIPE